MKKKMLSILIAIILVLSCLVPSVADDSTTFSDISVGVVEKNMETDIVEKKVYSCDENGFSEVEVLDEWVDETVNPIVPMSDEIILPDLENESNAIIGGSDGRTLVSNTQAFPYSAIAHLEIFFGLDSYRATGFYIADNIIVTAAHCLYDNERGWATSIYVRPGRNGLLSIPFGIAQVKNAAVSNEWHESFDFNYDWGVLTTYDTLIGNPGAFNMASVDDESGAITARISGYPKKIGSSTVYRQYEMSGSVSIVNPTRFTYTIDATEGQSGAPILNANNVVIGIHTAELELNGTPYINTGVRMTSQVLYYLNQYVDEHA